MSPEMLRDMVGAITRGPRTTRSGVASYHPFDLPQGRPPEAYPSVRDEQLRGVLQKYEPPIQSHSRCTMVDELGRRSRGSRSSICDAVPVRKGDDFIVVRAMDRSAARREVASRSSAAVHQASRLSM